MRGCRARRSSAIRVAPSVSNAHARQRAVAAVAIPRRARSGATQYPTSGGISRRRMPDRAEQHVVLVDDRERPPDRPSVARLERVRDEAPRVGVGVGLRDVRQPADDLGVAALPPRSRARPHRVHRAQRAPVRRRSARSTLDDDRDGAAVDAPGGARDVRGALRAEEDDHVGDLGGLGHAAERTALARRARARPRDRRPRRSRRAGRRGRRLRATRASATGPGRPR